MTRIRHAIPADLDALRTIQRSALAEPWPELLETAVEGPLPLLVALEHRPVGYAALVLGPEQTAYMPELAVSPDRQEEGIGSELVTAVVEFLDRKGYRRLRVTVRAADDRARRFYESHDFERHGRLDDHFESGDALTLLRRIGSQQSE